MSRPTRYSEQLADEICERISDGESLRRICNSPGMPSRETIRRWKRDVPGFVAKCARACEEQTESLAAEIIEIADDTDEDPRSRSVRISARQWMAEKLLPKKYGSRLDVQHNGDLDIRVVIGGDVPPAQ